MPTTIKLDSQLLEIKLSTGKEQEFWNRKCHKVYLLTVGINRLT